MRVPAGVVLAAVALTAVAAAPAEAVTRAEYVAQADSLCKRANRETKQVNHKYGPFKFEIADPDSPPEEKPSKQEQRKATMRVNRLFGGINRVFGHMVQRIAFLPSPAGDERAVTGWISGMRAYKRMTDRANQAFKRNQFGKWLQRNIRAFEALQSGASSVAGFGFRHCPADNLTQDLQAQGSGS